MLSAVVALTAALAGSTLTWVGEPAGGDARSVARYCADGTVHTRFEGTSPEGVHHLGFSDGRWKVVAATSRRAGVLRLRDGDDARRVRITLDRAAGTATLGDRVHRWERGAADC